MKKRVAAHDVALRKVGNEERRTFARVLRSTGHDARAGDLAFSFDSLRCAADGCEIRLFVKNESGEARTWSLRDVGVTLLGDAGDRVSVSVDVTLDAVELASRERRNVTIRTPKSVANALMLAQLCVTRENGQTCGMIKLR